MDKTTITRQQLAELIDETFEDYRQTGNLEAAEMLDKIAAIMLTEINQGRIKHNGGERVVYEYNTTEDLLEQFRDTRAAFEAGLSAYQYNMIDATDKKRPFIAHSDYFAFDGYGHLCGLRDLVDVAYWYRFEIVQHIKGEWIREEIETETLKELAAHFGATMEDEEADEEEETEEGEKRSTRFDGYNTVRQYRAAGSFELIEYVKDAYYSGGDDVYAVRLAHSMEDVDTFKTYEEALKFFEICKKTEEENGAGPELLDKCLEAWRAAK